jgi:Spx/MgsR family transcriptional regulator
LLESEGVDFERRDYFKERFSVDELDALLRQAGLSPGEVLSTRSRAYKDLGLAEREVSDRELVELMTENPTLIRRPIVVGSSGVVVGFNRRELSKLAEQER